MLKSIASLCYRRRGTVVLLWIALMVTLIAGGTAVGTGFVNEFEDVPGSESGEAHDILRANGFDERTGEQARIVFRYEGGIDTPQVERAMTEFLEAVEASVDRGVAVSPYSEAGANQASADGTIAYAEVNFAYRSWDGYVEQAEIIRDLAADIGVSGLEVEFGGDMFVEDPEFSNEIYGIIGAIIILLLTFGSVFAMFLPIIAALVGIGSSVGLIEGATRVISMPDFTIVSAAMIGIGVGIDYALLIVTRYRAALRSGQEPGEAVAYAVHTAGRAVLFAGTTFVISIFGLFFMGIDMIRGLAMAMAAAVLMTMIASVTLVPALLGIAGKRIDRIGLPWRYGEAEGGKGSVWYRWSRVVQRYPWPAATVGIVLVLVLTAPILTMRLGFADAGVRAEDDTTRRAHELLSEAFGPGFNGPLVLAAETPRGEGDLVALTGLSDVLNETPGVAFASQPILNEAGTAAILQVIPTTSPQEKATSDLVSDLRSDIVPAAMADSGVNVKVGGVTAAAQDFASYTGDRLPIFIAAVLFMSFVLLMAVFRSVVVALKAIVMNLFSIGAAYGLIVAVFQWGWGASLIGVHETAPIEAWAPMMLFAILFGLSMDYEVFLLSRIREEYDLSGDNTTAVADGLAATGRVITAAAAIMVVVFGSFALGDDRAIKLMGVGLAAAVLIDATLVRMVIVPATMELLGDRNWWMPRWLDRLLPRVTVEARAVPHSDGVAATSSGGQ